MDMNHMTVKDLKAELECYDEDMQVVFKFNGDVECKSWTENKYGHKTVYVDRELKPTFMCEVLGTMQIDLEIGEDDNG